MGALTTFARKGWLVVLLSPLLGACSGLLGINYLSNDEGDDAGPVDAGGTVVDATAPREAAIEAEASPGIDVVVAREASADAPTDTSMGAPDADAADAPSVEGSADAACTTTCTPGQSRCNGSAVETCEQTGGCDQWTTTSTCGAHQTCTSTATSAACTCNASLCASQGTVCQDGKTLATCSTDVNGCSYVASTTTCPTPQSCSGTSPSAACSTTCTNSCTQGQTACVSGGVATCTMGSNGCLSYSSPTACGTHQSCSGAAGSAACTCNTSSVCSAAGSVCSSSSTVTACASDTDSCLYSTGMTTCTAPQQCLGAAPNGACGLSCTDSCTKGQTTCTSSGLSTCALGSNGCWSYGAAVACGAHQVCTGSAGSGACTCSGSVCTVTGPVCESSSTLATCATDSDNCLYVSGTPMMCASPQVCSGTAPDAGCSLTCSNTCSQGQTECVSGGVATCTLGSNGCYSYGTPVSCGTHQTCTGATGAGACSCNTDPVCQSASNTCASGSVLATCAKDGQGCFYETGSSTCSNGACSGGACCTNACTNGATQCPSTSSTQLQSCTVGGNGCTAWTAASCSSGLVCERYGGAACVDPNWAEWPMPASSGSYTSNGDGTVTDNTTGLIWNPNPGSGSAQAAAISACASLSLGGFSDWRLPSVIELLSIIDPTQHDPAVNPTYFPGQSSILNYWTSTPVAGSSGNAFAVGFEYGNVVTNGTTNTNPYLCVR